ncbi:hypothetical protein A1F97_07896 [Pyrenophora tritici-repentis]|nr:hypothetical protein A1F97_07896 [Pyrenophora tritici-repentis]
MVNCPTNTQASTEHDIVPNHAAASTPRLPLEIILAVLQHVHPAQILDLRLLSSNITKDMDTHFLYHTIQRVELISYLSPKEERLFKYTHLAPKDYWDFTFVEATFDRMDDQPDGKAAWEPDGAHFRIDKAWFDTFRRIGGTFALGNAWGDHVRQCLDLENPPQVYGQLRWCVKIGPAVLDFGIEDRDELDIELVERKNSDEPGNTLSIRVKNWKRMLMNFFREERVLKTVMEQTKDYPYTYNHVEDSLRGMRRKLLRSKIDEEDRDDYGYIWMFDNMTPLWSNFPPLRELSAMEVAENHAIEALMLLRKEASISKRVRFSLRKLVKERTAMYADLQKLCQLFNKWQEKVLDLSNLGVSTHRYEDLDPNHMTWSKDVVDRELECLKIWKEQKPQIAQMVAILNANNAIATLDEAAVDDSGDLQGI